MIKLGVLGFGARISGVINHPLKAADPSVRVVGIVDPNEEAARARLAEEDRADVKFYDTLESMVREAKVDALAIGTRCHQHTPYAIEAAKTGLPIFLEKPVAINLTQATALEDAFEHARGEVVVSFPLRVSPLCEMAHDMLTDGAVGDPNHILAVNYVPYGTCYFDYQYREFDITQGLFLQKATHDFDYMSFLMDATITRVAAMASWGQVFGGQKPAGLVCSACDEWRLCLESPYNRKRNLSGGRGDDHPCLFGEDIGTPETGMNEDASSALVEFSSGAKGVYTQVFYTRREAGTRGATVSGYYGTVGFDWYTNKLKRVRHHEPMSDIGSMSEGMGHFGGDDALAWNFLDVIHGRAHSKTPITTGIQSAYACLAAKESAEQGRFVDVRQVGATAVK